MTSHAPSKAHMPPIAGLLTWLLPGAGHLYVGERVRGIILLVTITLTFWTGIAIGGVRNTVNPREKPLWFLAQVCAGGHSLATLGLSRLLPDDSPAADAQIAYGQSEEVAVVYTAICGLLNLLIIFDVLVRAEKTGQAPIALRAAGRRASP